MHQHTHESHRRDLEEEFFARQNQIFIDRIRSEQEHEDALLDLGHMSGIKDQNVLETLYKAGLSPSTLAALALVPLVQVAWADGRVDEREQEAVLQAAAEQGIDPGHPAYELLQNWLNEAPGPELFDKWQIYVQGLAQTLELEAIKELQAEIMKRAREVAESTGKLLGLGSGVSAAERRELERLDLVFRLTH